EELKNLKARVERLEGGGSTITSAHTNRLSVPSTLNILDPLDSVKYERSGITRSENTIQLGSDPMQSDPVMLQRTVRQLVQSELQSDSIR
ncbi:collagen alpha-1(XVII) chain isoform X1, partial [Clarias magur]